MKQMQVFKFGGASIKDAKAVRNMLGILKRFPDEKLLIVVSAMGKTTNALEEILDLQLKNQSTETALQDLYQQHSEIITDLFAELVSPKQLLDQLFDELKHQLLSCDEKHYDRSYDRIISFGEKLSSHILQAFFSAENKQVLKLNAFEVIRTDQSFRDATVEWPESQQLIQQKVKEGFKQADWILTQGFIAGTDTQEITTLGREGSDYTAAIFAACLQAEAVTIWKDVPGILNADPKKIADAILYPALSYQEAAEMTYYGASVIHPKTIKPLANAGIPLHVRSFSAPDKSGTIINNTQGSHQGACIIIKEKQSLLTFKVVDFSFVNEAMLGKIFASLSKHHIKINMMQNTAISFSICVNDDLHRLDQLIAELKEDFEILYNQGLELITIKNFEEHWIEKLKVGKAIYVEQRTRKNFQMVVKNEI